MKNGSKWIALVLCLLLTLGATSALAADSYKVGVMQYVEHPALDAATQGFLDALKAKGLIAGENLTVDVQNASADQATLQLM